MAKAFDGSKVNATRLTSASLSETTAQYIMDAILEGKISPEEPFPSQNQLCESFGVSRTVIREATQILVSRGILDVQHGKRITIRPPSHDKMAESVLIAFKRNHVSVFDVHEVRKLLEVEAAGLAAKRATEADLVRMEECLTIMEKHYSEKKGYADADVDFHKAIVAAAKQPALEMVLNSLADYLYESRVLSFRGMENMARVMGAHHAILQAIRNQIEADAREAMARHLQETEADLLHIYQ
ncbi:FadR/GntR family transcriptional regulator [Paenibacillus oryzisoli]|uniref:FadR/GntR family transcriptional regulator n=1 Tax=Paenibacillus oryzisoli TaxID=1850517 RepID=UPI003D29BCC6